MLDFPFTQFYFNYVILWARCFSSMITSSNNLEQWHTLLCLSIFNHHTTESYPVLPLIKKLIEMLIFLTCNFGSNYLYMFACRCNAVDFKYKMWYFVLGNFVVFCSTFRFLVSFHPYDFRPDLFLINYSRETRFFSFPKYFFFLQILSFVLKDALYPSLFILCLSFFFSGNFFQERGRNNTLKPDKK